MIWFPLCFSFGLIITISSDDTFRKPPYVTTENGVVKGQLMESNDFAYIAYLGIPFAAAPVGENRFKAPLPPMPWSGVFEANKTVHCPQSGSGEEDCLIINVFTPVPDKRAQHFRRPLPVLVFIHGGAFIRGTGPTKGMEYLLKHDIAVVTFNYRLGVLGFLCLGTNDVPGNAGMKDQVAALQWIQRNIINFGGHPSHVVIYGTDAGGVSVDLLVLSKMSNGLFKSAIVESGSATSSWSVQIDPISTAAELAGTLDFVPKDIEDLAKFYRNKTADDLTTVSDMYQNTLIDGTVGFAPCIETLSGAKPHIRQFLTESPYDTLKRGKYENVPLMFIYSTLEGLFLRSSQYDEYRKRMEANFEHFVPADLSFETDEDKRIVAEAIKIFYFGNTSIGDETIVEYLEYFGDYLVLHGILKSAEYHSKRMPVYLMEFFYKGHLRIYEPFYENITMAGHSAASDHAFVTDLITNHNDLRAVEKLTELITNFVRYDNPTPRPSSLVPVLWPPIENSDKLNYLRFGERVTVGSRPHWKRKMFWDSVYRLYRRQLSPVEPC